MDLKDIASNMRLTPEQMQAEQANQAALEDQVKLSRAYVASVSTKQIAASSELTARAQLRMWAITEAGKRDVPLEDELSVAQAYVEFVERAP